MHAARGLAHLDTEIDKVTRSSLEMAAAGKVAASGASSTLTSLGDIGKNLKGSLLPIAIGAGAAFAPVIGAAVGAAVIGAVGAGGIVGGIVLASKDVRVDAAWRALGSSLGKQLSDDSSVFVGPLLGAADQFEASFRRVEPGISRIFTNLSRSVGPLAGGTGGFVEKLAPGLERLSEAAGPFFEEFGRDLPELGDAIGDFSTSIADAGPEITQFLHTAMDDIGEFVRETGDLINVLANINAAMDDFSHQQGNVFSPMNGMSPADMRRLWDGATGSGLSARAIGPLPDKESLLRPNDMSDVLNQMTSTAKQWKQAMEDATRAVKQQDDALHALANTVNGSISAEVAWEQAWDDLTDAVAANGHTLDAHTQAGRDNLAVVEASISAADRTYTANRNAGMGVEEATAAYNRQIGKLRDHMMQLGFNKQAVDDLIGRLRAVPDIKPKVTMDGVKSATADVMKLAYEVMGLPNVTRTVTYITGSRQLGSAYASGTDYAPGGMAWVGEEGPELMYVPRGAQIWPHGQSMQMASAPGYAGGVGTGGGNTAPINIYGGGLGEVVMAYIRSEVASQGGDVQAVLGRN